MRTAFFGVLPVGSDDAFKQNRQVSHRHTAMQSIGFHMKVKFTWSLFIRWKDPINCDVNNISRFYSYGCFWHRNDCNQLS